MDFWALTSDIVNSQICIKSCILKTLQTEDSLGLSLRKAAKAVLLSVCGKKTVLLANNAALLILTLKASMIYTYPWKCYECCSKARHTTEPLMARGKGSISFGTSTATSFTATIIVLVLNYRF